MTGATSGTAGAEPRSADFVAVGRVVTMSEARTIIPDGAVAVIGSEIAAVGSRAEILARFAPRRVLGNDRAIILPGLIDAHTHCTQSFVRSLTAGELPMIPRLYVPAQRSLSPAQAQAATRLVAAQLIRAGVTTVCEGNLSPEHDEAVIEAIEETGIRCCFARGASDQEFHHAALYEQLKEKSWIRVHSGKAEKDLERTAALLERFPPKGDGLIRAAITSSTLTGFSEAYFKEAASLARRHGTTLQVHVARDREEVEFCLSLWGRRPVERLAEMGVIDQHLVAIHAVLATGREIALLAEGGAGLAHSPLECVSNGNAFPDIQRFRQAGVRVALGCDNQANDMFATMRAMWALHTGIWGIPLYQPDYLSADEILAMATCESARVLHWADRIGSLEPGKAADLVVLDGDAPHLMATQDLAAEVVRFASRAEVRQTIVNGRLLFDEGAFATVDLDRLFSESAAGAAHTRDVVEGRRYRPIRRPRDA